MRRKDVSEARKGGYSKEDEDSREQDMRSGARKKNEEAKAKGKELNELFKIAVSQPKVPLADHFIWQPTSHGRFTIAFAVNLLRPSTVPPSWSPLVWWKGHVPCFAMIMWLLSRKRLSTLDRLSKWGLATTNCCVFCSRAHEDHDHLFFGCLFTKFVLLNTLQWLHSVPPGIGSWWDIQDWLQHLHFQAGVHKPILLLAISVVVYTIWQERKKRIFMQQIKSRDDLLYDIKYTVRLVLCGWHFEANIANV